MNPDLLFVGTELGLWVSLDGGRQWAQFKGGDLPNVAVRDIAIHPRDHDLVLATHGRGIWIVDDITPLRALTAEMLAKEVAFLPRRRSSSVIPAFGGWVNGDEEFDGPESARRRRDRLLPEEAPHLRRPQDRDLRLRRQEARRPSRAQAPRPDPRELVDAPEAAARADRGQRGLAPPSARASCRERTRSR